MGGGGSEKVWTKDILSYFFLWKTSLGGLTQILYYWKTVGEIII